MAIRREETQPENDYTIIPNAWLRDTNLSLKARGLLSLLMSHRVGWNITIESLARDNPEGKAAIRSAVGELEQRGYLRREQTHNHGGQFSGFDYVLEYSPSCDNRTPPFDNPSSDNPSSDNPSSDNRTHKKTIDKKTIDKEDYLSVLGSRGSPKGHRVPPNFKPKPETIEHIKQQCPGLNLQLEHENFMDYWEALPGTKAHKLDWDKTWRNWMRRAAEKQPAQKPAWQQREQQFAAERQYYAALDAQGAGYKPPERKQLGG